MGIKLINTTKSKCQEENLLLNLNPELRNQRERSSKRKLRREFPRSLKVDLLKPKFSRVEKSPRKLPPEERRTYGWLPSKKLEELLKSKVSVLLEVNPELDKLYSLRPAHYTKNDDL